MADIRIKDLATTAASTASDDFVAVDGSANGTRKLNAYSPTFGGNLTVSGTGAHVFGTINTVTLSGGVISSSAAAGANNYLLSITTNDQAANRIRLTNSGSGGKAWSLVGGEPGANNSGFTIYNETDAVKALIFTPTGNATLAGNLTVSGTGTSSVAGNLGVGTTSASAPLTVYGTPVNPDTNVYGQVRVTDNNTAYNAGPRAGIYFSLRYNSGGALTAGGSSIQSYKANTTDGNFATGLQFTTQANGAAPAINARLTDTGNFLLGTTTDGGQKLQVAGTATVSGNTTLTSTTASSSTTTGALVVSGGVGVAGALFTGGKVSVNSWDVIGSTNGLSFNTTNNDGSATQTSYYFQGQASKRVRLTMGVNGVTTFGFGADTNANTYFTTENNTASNAYIWKSNVGYASDFSSTGTTLATLNYSTGNLAITGSLTTAAPSGGTAGAWKLGVRVAATTTLDTTQYLQVDIGGTLYKVALVTS